MTIQVLLLLLSFVLLYYGAEFALEQAEVIGKYFHLSPLVIGVLLVGFGTSLPEFFVSQLATFRGSSEIALGNIVGSNISNIFLILGVALLIVPIGISSKALKDQFVFHIGITLLLIYVLTRPEMLITSSLLLMAFFMSYLYFTFRRMKKEGISDKELKERVQLGWKAPTLLITGFILLYLGGELLVSSGQKIGKALGVSEYVLSAIVVAFGTSFPELMTALIASIKKKDVNLIIGNIIGSNIFNVAFVLGSLGIYKFKILTDFSMEFGVLTAVSVIFLLLHYKKESIGRLIGISFLLTYSGIVYWWLTHS